MAARRERRGDAVRRGAAAPGGARSQRRRRRQCRQLLTCSMCRSSSLSQADALPHNFELRSLLPPWPLLGALAVTCVPRLLLETFTSEGDNMAGVLALAAVALQLAAASSGGARHAVRSR
ncbi:hypothetical protein MNEG_4752 [Monoraphidium neglectum]|uniref:Uncharacterized protein n=1 Tax=Monoraphidium neglectum TaxID=145388 RepID=A0A0D2JX63_9CHLO|nr:hypothetical protein MNEG_4752 [Monoraphidium neglectum]KIZ03203.1 hypothetical protein MNEG_4752 [Monoraphidium neglectum]|eukprot:XP_013902222.1 hypothetical protein MNEG_4752 [Monoraphidium neglectum]